jgi:hypothetical protein
MPFVLPGEWECGVAGWCALAAFGGAEEEKGTGLICRNRPDGASHK